MAKKTYQISEQVTLNFKVYGWVATLKNKLIGNPTWERLLTDAIIDAYSKQMAKVNKK